ncbi:MAG: diacylglycerol kinase family lipid kinase [Bacteroides sp.]|nr:diacylglycerol kinase family lipid kinase [Eubacterium sp.]MCM1419321.1 diacylglycerol kinase family lipid kinase [Roseburia sp.]MCM1463151.1 diacylglycerol kinase family lipid kinase [Bacteroides sp.]
MPKILFIYNPHSGTGRIAANLSDVADIFTKGGYEVVVYPTQSAGDCTRRVRAALKEGYDRIAAAGGDGMLHELVEAVADAEERPILGYIPTGTVNDFAASHGIPRNIREAAENIVRGVPTPLDAGRFEEAHFSYVAAFGIITHVAYETDQQIKNKLGSLAYFLEILKSMDLKHLNDATCFMRIAADGFETSGDFIFGAVMNSTSLGSIRDVFAKDVKFDDGLLEGIFIRRPKSLGELDELKKRLFDKSLDASCIEYVKSAEFRFEPEREIAWTLDGENGGSRRDVTIRAAQKAIRVVLPAKG